jgi:glycosyltransferase involved in cell wall biosynthesis
MALAALDFSLFSPPASETSGVHRVVHAISPSRYSGAERVLARLVPRLEARGHAIHCVCSRHSAALPEFRSAGVVIEPLSIGGKLNLLAPQALQRSAERFRAHFLHTHLSSASWWAGWSEQFGGIPSLGHVHGFTSAVWHRQQTHLLAVSQAVKNHLVEHGIDDHRITVLRNAVDPDDVLPKRLPAVVREEFGAQPDSPIVGCFAHLSPKKGWADLFQAIPQVLRSFPNACFWCVGEGPLRAELKAVAAREGFLAQVCFTGFRRDVADLMRAVDLVVLPSHREPLGLVYLEAGLLSRPVIGCNAGGAPELILQNETGLLVPPQNPQALANAIKTLLDSPQRAREMGRRGNELARTEFTWTKYLTKLEAVYERMRV